MTPVSKQPDDGARDDDTQVWEPVPTREVVADGEVPTGGEVATSGQAGPPIAADGQAPGAEGGHEEAREPVAVPATSGLSVGMWVALVGGALVLVLLLVFILQNNVSTEIHFFGWAFALPLGVSLLLAAVGGLLIAGVIGSIRILQLSHRLRKVGRSLK